MLKFTLISWQLGGFIFMAASISIIDKVRLTPSGLQNRLQMTIKDYV